MVSHLPQKDCTSDTALDSRNKKLRAKVGIHHFLSRNMQLQTILEKQSFFGSKPLDRENNDLEVIPKSREFSMAQPLL
jgi:hypothetical protein